MRKRLPLRVSIDQSDHTALEALHNTFMSHSKPIDQGTARERAFTWRLKP